MVDTGLSCSLADARAAPAELGADLLVAGGYFSPRRRCVAIAVDSAYHELVHEMIHLAFHERCVRAAAEPGRPDPLRTHWEAMRARGFGGDAAEELVCRAHQLHALSSSGRPVWQWGSTALLVLDSALLQASGELRAMEDEEGALLRLQEAAP